MAGMLGNDIKWNFGKFLLDGEGKAGGSLTETSHTPRAHPLNTP